ncbi:hypothetical protein BHM03_00002874, partial [Ensete ventricosum]
MGISSEEAEDRRMQGWLYLVRSNRLGLQYSRKRYFVLDGNALNCYKNVPASNREVLCMYLPCAVPLITKINLRCPNLQLGARSSEEAARWIRSIMEEALKAAPCKWEKQEAPFRLCNVISK